MSIELGTPLAALAALVGLVPLAAALLRGRQAGRLRRVLGLADPPAASRLGRPLALACAFALLGLAAAQPTLVRQSERRVRTDAQMLVVLDSSRSMLASARRGTAPRYRRAVSFARRVRAAIPELPAGVASLNNRLLPYVFPTIDEQTYSSVVRHAYGVQKPPPALDPDPLATDFGVLTEVTTQRFFAGTARKRVLLVLSDAESRSFDVAGTLSALRRSRTTPVVVRIWEPGERIFRPGTGAESYRSTQPDALAKLRAAGWPAYRENQFEAVVRRIEEAIGSGPEAAVGYRRQETSIAPAVALAAVAPLLLVFVPSGLLPRRRRPAVT